jgi:hypoxanthine-DNA glycosylase
MASKLGEQSNAVYEQAITDRNTASALREQAADAAAERARLAALAEARIGLWDVIRSAARATSSDGDIRDADAHDLSDLVATLPDLRMIAFNGGKAAAIGRRQLPDAAGIALIDLPSSSAAHTIGFDAKLAAWSQLREALGKS